MAAGLGFKTFTTGEVLTAADTNGYLMQGVLVFASSAARASAITSPQEGQYSYLKDTDALEYYSGSAWVGAPVGDITGVTAGTGISGGGTSGTVTITNSMATAIDAKGDLVAGTGADAFSRLAVGSNNTVLTADSAEATGLKWATPASGGGMTLLSTTALTGASVTTASIASTYKHLYLVIADSYQATTLGGIYMRFNSDTGSNYNWSYIRNINVTVAGSNNTDTKIQISSRSPSTNTAGKLNQIEVSLPRYTDTTPRGVHANAYMHDDTNPGNQRTDATYFGSAAISTITLFGDYNFSGGNLYVYGVS